MKRTTRTAARRTLVRSSVKGRLAELFKSSSSDSRDLISTLSIPQLSIFGNRNDLDIPISDDDDFGCHYGGGNGTAVAVAPRSSASAILAAYRQVTIYFFILIVLYTVFIEYLFLESS